MYYLFTYYIQFFFTAQPYYTVQKYLTPHFQLVRYMMMMMMTVLLLLHGDHAAAGVQLLPALAGRQLAAGLLLHGHLLVGAGAVVQEDRAQVHDEHSPEGGAEHDGEHGDGHNLLAPVDDLRVSVGFARSGQENGA